MEFGWLIFKDLLAKFCMMLVGFALVRLRICPHTDSKTLSRLCLYVAGPCALFGAFQMPFSRAMLTRFGAAAALSAAVMLLFILLAKIAGKCTPLDAVSRASLIYSNNGSFLVSLISALMGNEAVFYLSAFIAMHNVLFWTHGYAMLTHQPKVRLRNMLNPNVVAIFIGFVFFLTSASLPSVLDNAVQAFGSLNGPLCMLMVGMALATCDFRNTFGKCTVWLVSLGRLVLFPLAALGALLLIGAPRWGAELEMLVNVVILAASCPVANHVLQVALLYTKEGTPELDVAASVNTLSTCLCIVTIPIMVILYQILA